MAYETLQRSRRTFLTTPGFPFRFFVCVALGALKVGGAAPNEAWGDVQQILEDGVKDHVFPGAVAIVGNKDGILFQTAVGSQTYGQKTPLGGESKPLSVESTVFDMASCTKVLATTSAISLLFQEAAFGEKGLSTPVSSILKGFGGQGKEDISVENCLLHNAAFPPDPTPDFWDPKFGCKGAPLPSSLNFDCSENAFKAVLGQTLRPGAKVGGAYVYSDISFITLMYVAGAVALDKKFVTASDFLPACNVGGGENLGLHYQCGFEAFVRMHVFSKLGMDSTQFLPQKSEWEDCAPTTIPTGEPKVVEGVALQGRVEDGNAYMLGGIAGHAGLFSNALDINKLMQELMFENRVLNKSTVERFIVQHNHSQSSRALGWNTNDITAQPDGGWDESCGSLSAKTFTHVGYTGTQVCGDPEKEVYTILLTARVYNSSNTGNSTGIHSVRKRFNTAVVDNL
jgi:serine-type D-Ala-D-Ala carboxypeptidase